MSDKERGERISLEPHTTWYHGSPLRLELLAEGSTVTPVRELAKAFAHKPTIVSITVHATDGSRRACIEHDGQRDGFLYRVQVEDPAADLRQHPRSAFAPGEEMLTTRDLPLEYLCFLPVADERMEGVENDRPAIRVRAVQHRHLAAQVAQRTGEPG